MSVISTKVAGLLLLVAAWGVVLRGLFLLPPSTDPALDLEAGPAFAVNFSVYLPALVLCILLLVALPVSVGTRRGAPVGVAAGFAVGIFALWVLTQRSLLGYFPGLRAALWLAIGLVCAGLLAYSMAYALQPTKAAPQAETTGAQRGS